MGAVLQDIQYTVRSLRKSPGFTIVVILTLGLGIGFNTAIYSVIDAFLLRPLPVRDPGQLVVLAARDKHSDVPHGMSFPDYRDYRQLTVFSDMLARREFAYPAQWKQDHRSETMWLDAVTTNYFDLLGIHASRGRTFEPSERRLPVGVLDYAFWRTKLGGDVGVIGHALNLDGHLVTVIGVAPEGFQGTQVSMRPDIYVPLEAPGLSATTSTDRFEQRDDHELRILGRLKPGVTIPQARSAVKLLAAQLEQQYPETNKGVKVITMAERFARPEPQVSQAMPAIAVFSMAIVGLVLLIACANIANLLLVRATRRSKEMALRTAIGASRLRIVRLLLTEGVILAVCGGAAGVAVAEWGIRVIRSRPVSVDLPVYMDWSPDGRVLLFATAVALLTGILCGLMPAMEVSRPDLSTALKEGGRSTGSKRRLSSLLVGGQVGVSMVLLIMAGLFIKGAEVAQQVDLGFDRNNLQLLTVDLGKQNYDTAHGREFVKRLLEEMEAMPGVRGASVANCIPFERQGGAGVFSDEQVATRPSDALSVLSNTVGVDYFRVVGIPVLRGRVFNTHDNEDSRRVAVINEALAVRLWPGKDPLLRQIRLVNGDVLQVVGVVKTGKYAFLSEQPRPYLYLPFLQNYTTPTIFHVRTAGPPADVVPALREAIRGLNRDLPVYAVKTMRDHLEHGYVFSTIILGGALSGLFGLLGLALASIGLYGVVANTVSQRTREIGIRTALGATRLSILHLVTGQSMVLVLMGAAFGTAGGLAAGQMLKRILFSVQPGDWKTVALAAAVLAATAAFACWIPARRAAKVDPTVALRWE